MQAGASFQTSTLAMSPVRLFILIALLIISFGSPFIDAIAQAPPRPQTLSANDLRQLTAKAEQGDVIAQYDLGVKYAIGQGAPNDLDEARKWYSKAALQGYAPAQYKLGLMYENLGSNEHGKDQSRDYAEAVTWYGKAAQQGYAVSQFSLGEMYYDGRGAPKDYAEAVSWFHKAAEQDQTAAQYALADMYVKGVGVPRNHAEAMKWYQRAADRGGVVGQYKLGILYLEGAINPPDYQSAYKWLSLAAATGDKEARDALDSLEPRLTPSQRADAQKMAISWLPLPPSNADGEGPTFDEFVGQAISRPNHQSLDYFPLALLTIGPVVGFMASRYGRNGWKWGSIATFFGCVLLGLVSGRHGSYDVYSIMLPVIVGMIASFLGRNGWVWGLAALASTFPVFLVLLAIFALPVKYFGAPFLLENKAAMSLTCNLAIWIGCGLVLLRLWYKTRQERSKRIEPTSA